VGSYSRPGVLQGQHGVLRLVDRLVGGRHRRGRRRFRRCERGVDLRARRGGRGRRDRGRRQRLRRRRAAPAGRRPGLLRGPRGLLLRRRRRVVLLLALADRDDVHDVEALLLDFLREDLGPAVHDDADAVGAGVRIRVARRVHDDVGVGSVFEVVLLELFALVRLRELVPALLGDYGATAGVDVALVGGGCLVLRPPHDDHDRHARRHIAELRPERRVREVPVQNPGFPVLRRLADVDAVEDVPVVVDPLLDALPVTVLPECEESRGVLERVLLQRIVVDHRPACGRTGLRPLAWAGGRDCGGYQRPSVNHPRGVGGQPAPARAACKGPPRTRSATQRAGDRHQHRRRRAVAI
ncbi:unnamed protein product, partial [Pelagomonas calceolata]